MIGRCTLPHFCVVKEGGARNSTDREHTLYIATLILHTTLFVSLLVKHRTMSSESPPLEVNGLSNRCEAERRIEVGAYITSVFACTGTRDAMHTHNVYYRCGEVMMRGGECCDLTCNRLIPKDVACTIVVVRHYNCGTVGCVRGREVTDVRVDRLLFFFPTPFC